MISYDNNSGGSNSSGGASLSVSHTIFGNQAILVIGVSVGNLSGLSAVTYRGQAMTFLDNYNENSNTQIYCYYTLATPGIGTIDITRVSTSGFWLMSKSLSYAGVAQQAPTNVYKNTKLPTTSSTLYCPITTTVNNGWAVSFMMDPMQTGKAPISGTTVRGTRPGSMFIGCDSNQAITPAGLYTLGVGMDNTDRNECTLGFEIDPFMYKTTTGLRTTTNVRSITL